MSALMSIKNRHTKRRLGDLFDMTVPHRCKVTDLTKWKSMYRQYDMEQRTHSLLF